jgi:hypothetical protein
MMSNGGVMTIDKTTKLDPATTVLGLRAGEKVALDEGDFLQPPRPLRRARDPVPLRLRPRRKRLRTTEE